jgi:glycosyltransferase involved in cell wall biosynthesis
LAFKTLPADKRPLRVSTFHGFYSVNRYSAVMTRGARIIAVSHTISAHIQSAYGIPEDRIVVISRGVEPAVYDSQRVTPEEREAQRRTWGVTDPEIPVLLLPGRFTRLKGHLLLLSALAELTDFPWAIVLLGDHAENPQYTRELIDLASRFRIEGRLLTPGHSDRMPLAYAAADLVLNTSTTPESFGRTAVEAMAMGRPVVVSGHGGSMETVFHGQTGWHFAPGDKKDLVRILKIALSERDRWPGMGVIARNHAVSNFSLQTMCARTLAVYKEVLREKALCRS